MLLGVPCIASNVGGVADICSIEDGLLYDDCDPFKLAQAMKDVFYDLDNGGEECRKRIEKAKEHARIRHDGEANFQRLLEIYRDRL